MSWIKGQTLSESIRGFIVLQRTQSLRLSNLPHLVDEMTADPMVLILIIQLVTALE